MNEDRARRVERQQTERRQYEDAKRTEANEKALEEARQPAFYHDIEDCSTLIGYLSRFTTAGASSVPEPTLSTSTKAGPAGVPALQLRQADKSDFPEGAVIMKKKGQDADSGSFFAGTGGKKGKKGAASKKASDSAASTETSGNQALNVSFQTVAALLQLNISAPLSRDDVPKTIEALKEKKKYFEENQVRAFVPMLDCLAIEVLILRVGPSYERAYCSRRIPNRISRSEV